MRASYPNVRDPVSAPKSAGDAAYIASAAFTLWRETALNARLRILRRFLRGFTGALPEILHLMRDRPASTVLVAEILPLLSACRFLLTDARRILSPGTLSLLGRPLWLAGVTSRVERRPLGTILILAPGNYPLMLAGIQTLQAIVAGNTVILKPAPGRTALLSLFLTLLRRAGLPGGVVTLLQEDAGADACARRHDLIILTGGRETGRKVAAAAAATLTPTIMELSGADPVFVLADADLSRVARALCFSALLNRGETCIAPRRVFIDKHAVPRLVGRLRSLLGDRIEHGRPLPPGLESLRARVAQTGGDVLSLGQIHIFCLDAAHADLADLDLFAPWFAIIGVSSMDEAVALDERAEHCLGASIFGPEEAANALAGRIQAGTITINDVIVPSADPRLPFGGAKQSGYGVTRGIEGLQALTRPVSVSARRRFAFHLLPAGFRSARG